MSRLRRNAVRCLRCGDVVDSTSLHQIARCSCGAVTVDGGLEYAKRIWVGGAPEEVFDELSEIE